MNRNIRTWVCIGAVVSGLAWNLFAEPARSLPPVTIDRVRQAIDQVPKTHPRLFADSAQFEALKTSLPTSEIGRLSFDRLCFESDQICTLPPSARKLEGRRLLSVSRTVLYRVSTLSMAYRLTGKKAYLDRCVAEMRAVAAFTDWNPSHFLDVAEMTLAVAIGYDWLWQELDPELRTSLETAILEKGLRPSLKVNHSWIKGGNNWGQVCHAGMLGGALALLDHQPGLASQITHRLLEGLPHTMAISFAPKGCYPEGPSYWSYGTDFNVLAIAMLNSVLHTDFGLSQLPGFKETANYMDLVTGPSGLTFNYADGGMSRGSDFALWWFAKRFDCPDVLAYFEASAYQAVCKNRTPSSRLTAFTLFWLQQPVPDITPRAPLCWFSEGSTPIVIFRSSWNNAHATFAGLKAGSPSASHGHMDGGSFVFDSDGIRWAYDLGAENYNRIESLGIKLWGFQQNSERWTIFRLSNFSHNTLLIDNQLQRASARANVLTFTERPLPSATLDLTPLYTNATQVLRTATLLPTGEFRIVDTLEGLRPGVGVRWTLMTKATPDASATGTITLREKGKMLTLTAEHDRQQAWQVLDAATPKRSWDAPNPGMKQIGFEIAAPASGKLHFSVLLTPGSTRP